MYVKAGGAFAAAGSSTATIKTSGAINLYSGGAAAYNGWPLSLTGSGAGSSMSATTGTKSVPVGERDT